MKEYPPEVLQGFGFVIVDECHYSETLLARIEYWKKEELRLRFLILTDRRAHLEWVRAGIAARGLGTTTGIYVGGMSQTELDKSTQCDFVLGTVAMCSKGFDGPWLDRMVLVTPTSAVQQAVGRVKRKFKIK